MSKKIYCTGCNKFIEPRLTNGAEIYKHRADLWEIPLWVCDYCGNYVGCHHKSSNPTRPLGAIPTREIRELRSEIHKLIDPLWKSGGRRRREVYRDMSERLGWGYHTGAITSLESGKEALAVAKVLAGLEADQ